MKRLFYLLLSLLLVNSFDLKASKVLASSFGFNSTNVTSVLQTAILSPNDTVIVDLQSANWKTAPLTFFNLNNKTIIFQKGVVLEAINGAFNGIYDCLLRLDSAQNVHLIGYGATFKMNKSEYALLNNSEYRHSISLSSCTNLSIKGLLINESGGDGIYVGGEGFNRCKSILIEDVICDNHYRQGMSITSAEDMSVRYCKFLNTQGTLPEAGVDVEPYQITQRIVNLKFEHCAFENNGWSGLALALFELDSNSLPVSISVTDCYFKNNCLPSNTYVHSEIVLSADDNKPVQGNVLFERCFIDGSQYAALYTRKTADAYSVKFKNCAFQNVSQLQIPFNEPIFLEVPNYASQSDYIGGLEFDNVLISYATNFSFFRVYGWSTLPGIKDISGNFTIVEPNNSTAQYSNVQDTVNVTYTYTTQTALPNTTVGINALNQTAVECGQVFGVNALTRSSTNTNYPLGVAYTSSGTCILGDDVHHLSGGRVFPPSSNQVLDSIQAREDHLVEPTETVTISIAPRPLYTLAGNNTSTFQVVDCNALSLSKGYTKNDIVVYPNPSNSIVEIRSAFTIDKIEVFGVDGRLYLVVDDNKVFSTLSLNKGAYQLKVYSKSINYNAKLIVID
jgi:hypothetical protein